MVGESESERPEALREGDVRRTSLESKVYLKLSSLPEGCLLLLYLGIGTRITTCVSSGELLLRSCIASVSEVGAPLRFHKGRE